MAFTEDAEHLMLLKYSLIICKVNYRPDDNADGVIMPRPPMQMIYNICVNQF